ncbi:MAG: hypothetical protein MZV64_71995 [Ignavibacteriales bacterium]|nr:hypothetical protein [Ignavibacteriales bacterium]
MKKKLHLLSEILQLQMNQKLLLKVNLRKKKTRFKCALLLELEIQVIVIKITGIMLDFNSLIFLLKKMLRFSASKFDYHFSEGEFLRFPSLLIKPVYLCK